MTYPFQPGGPVQGQPWYPPQQPQHPPQQPQYPPQQPQYPPQQPQYPPQQPQYPPPKATLADFYDQPAGGAKPLQFPDRAFGTRYTFIVPRPLSDADTEIQLDKQNQIRRYRDGTAMQVLKVPCLMNPSAEYPDGTANWYVKGHDRDELARAMSEAMVPRELMKFGPEAGAVITVEYTHDRPVPGGYNPAKVKRVTYTRPQGAVTAPAQQAGNGQQAPQDTPPWEPPVQVQVPAQQQAPVQVQPQWTQPGAPLSVPPQPQWPQPGAPLSVPPQPAPPGENPYGQQGPAAQVAAATQAGVAAAAQHQPPQAPPQISDENARLIAQLTGQQLPQ